MAFRALLFAPTAPMIGAYGRDVGTTTLEHVDLIGGAPVKEYPRRPLQVRVHRILQTTVCHHPLHGFGAARDVG